MTHGPHWQQSSFCGGGGNNCLQVAAVDTGALAIRESETPERVLSLDRAALRALFTTMRANTAASRP